MGWFGMNFDPLSFAIGKHGDSGPVRDVVSYLIGQAVGTAGEIWQTLTNVAVASFTAVSTTLRDLVVDVTPVQSGSGDPSPTNVRPISGWTGANIQRTGKNLLGGIIVANRIADGASSATIDESAKTITFDTVGNDGTLLLINDSTQGAKFYPFKLSTAYTIIGKLSKTGSGTSFGLGVIYTDGTSYHVQTSDIDSDGYLVFTTNASKTVRGIFAGYQQVNGQLLYYDTFGVYEGVVAKTDSAPYTGTTYTVAFPTPPGTVYGGTLTWLGGNQWKVQPTMTLVDLGSLSWEKSSSVSGGFYSSGLTDYKFADNATFLCGAYKPDGYGNVDEGYYGANNTFRYLWVNASVGSREIYIHDDAQAQATAEEFRSTVNGVKLCYELANLPDPIIFTVPSSEIKTLLGQNNIFADCGNINTITYRES